MIKTLFFYCYYAYLLGNEHDTRMYYEMLREEFKLSGKIDSLSHWQLNELRHVKDSLESGKIPKNKWIHDPSEAVPGTGACKVQTELSKEIFKQGLGQLSDLLHDNVTLYNVEHPCPPYGFVDMVCIGEKIVYPIELKKDIGGHDLIGQINKYDLYHRLRLHLNMYQQVQSVTICNSYQDFALKELKSMGVITLAYSLDKQVLHLCSV